MEAASWFGHSYMVSKSNTFSGAMTEVEKYHVRSCHFYLSQGRWCDRYLRM